MTTRFRIDPPFDTGHREVVEIRAAMDLGSIHWHRGDLWCPAGPLGKAASWRLVVARSQGEERRKAVEVIRMLCRVARQHTTSRGPLP
jgi:hypothetical protein